MDAALDMWSKEKTLRVLDIGTGCGNLLLSILYNRPNAVGVGIDISARVLELARENGDRLGLADRARFVQQDMAQITDTHECYDVIVCNPPYLSADVVKKHQKEHNLLAHEPAEALFAQDDGYEWYTVLSKVAPMVMHKNSRLVLECGKGMMERVKLILGGGWEVVQVRKDKQGWDRCLVLKAEKN